MQITGLKNIDWLIFFFLFGKKVSNRDPRHSVHAICTSINSALGSSMTLLLPTEAITDGSASASLDKLVHAGLVKRIKVTKRRRAVSTEGGRPPSHVYEACSIGEIVDRILREIDEKKRKLLMILTGLRQLEEEAAGRSLRSGG